MICPVCDNQPLTQRDLADGPSALACERCGGSWIQSFNYWRWREGHGTGAALGRPAEECSNSPREHSGPLRCPECRGVLLPYRVGHGLEFSVDRCGHCGGMWLDPYEWESLRGSSLHEHLHLIFSQVWQAHVQLEARNHAEEANLKSLLGERDLTEIRRVKAWLDGHPHRETLYALLIRRAS